MQFTWFSRRGGVFSHELTVSYPEPRSGEGRIWWRVGENPYLLENHVKWIFAHACYRTLCCQNVANNNASMYILVISWKTMWNGFSPMHATVRCVAKMLPIIMRRCIYWCQSGAMEISPTYSCSYHLQHSVACENSHKPIPCQVTLPRGSNRRGKSGVFAWIQRGMWENGSKTSLQNNIEFEK